jgi:type III secretory pathway component EscU
MEHVIDKLKKLSNENLIKLSEELRLPTVPDDALIREVIKDTEMDTTAPMIAFVGVGQLLSFELADRLTIVESKIKLVNEIISSLNESNENKDENNHQR